MSSKTKIIVLHMKEVVYTTVFLALAILLLVVFLIMFGSGKKESAKKPAASSTGSAESARYIPGIYTSTISLGDQTFDIQVDVEQDRITAISMNNLSETTAAMYPLMEPALDSIASQIYETRQPKASFTARITATPPNCLSWQSTRLSIRPAILLQPNKVKNGS